MPQNSASPGSGTGGADGSATGSPLSTMPSQSPVSQMQRLPGSPDPFPYFTKFTICDPVEIQTKSTWASDMELMHHYSTTACYTLPRGREITHIWQHELVQIALIHDPLLHQILAISAFHLAHNSPIQHRNYAMLASQHQSEAARGLRAQLMNPTPENSHANFAAASLLIIGAFAAQAACPGSEESSAPCLKDMLDIFMLARGMNVVLHAFEEIVQNGRFKDLFTLPNFTRPMIYMEAICGRLRDLSIQLKSEEQDPTVLRIVDDEISGFIACIKDSVYSAPVPEVRVLVRWPIMLKEEFLKLLQQRNPTALTVFSYYCAVVHEAQASAWYTSGWGLSVARDVKSSITSLQAEAIRWPLACMGLVDVT